MNINRKIISCYIITLIGGIISTSNYYTLASIDYSDTTVEELFRVLVTVTGMEENCEEKVKITVAYKSNTFELYEGDERSLEEQRADPISSEGHEIVFPKGQIAAGETFDVCVEITGGFSDCKVLINSPAKQPEDVTFSID